MSAFRLVRNGVMFLAALILSCAVIRRYLPFPEVDIVSDKLEHLARRGDDYEALFIGSSRVQFQIAPALFTATAAKYGVFARSFNAGVWAMTPPEDGYFVDQVLRQPHRRLRWVFIESMEVAPQGAKWFAGTSRSTYWHDWERTALMETRCLQDCASLVKRPGVPRSEQAQACGLAFLRSADNLMLFTENLFNLGRGEDLVSRWVGSPSLEKGKRHKKHMANDGWVYPKGNQRMNAEIMERYESDFARLQQTPQRFFDNGDLASEEAMRTMVEKFIKIGVTPILLIAPTVAARRFIPSPALARSLTIFDFSDPEKYPDLFAPQYRLDGVHLNIAGSQIFTHAIAVRFAEYARAH